MEFWINLFWYTLMISTAVVVGGLIPLFLTSSRKQLHLLLSFSAGMMLGAALLHLLPASIELIGSKTASWVLAGFLFLYIFEKFVTVHICEVLECEVHTLGIVAIVGISAHAMTDGIALGSGLLVSQLGLIVFLTIFFHKLPEAFALTSILLHESRGRLRIFLFNLLLIVMVPFGAILVRSLIPVGNAMVAGYALAFSAGTFLHISLSDLLPDVHKHIQSRYTILLSFLGGLAAMALLDKLLPHEPIHF